MKYGIWAHLAVLAAASLVSGCGYQPDIPDNADEGPSLQFSIRAVNGTLTLPSQRFVASYHSQADACLSTGRAFGLFPTADNLPATDYRVIPAVQPSPGTLVVNVPLPAQDKCDWRVSKVSPSTGIKEGQAGMLLNGKPVEFWPQVELISRYFLPSGTATYYCAPSSYVLEGVETTEFRCCAEPAIERFASSISVGGFCSGFKRGSTPTKENFSVIVRFESKLVEKPN